MNPNTYVAYLCLLENNSDIRANFMRWRDQEGRMSPSKYNGALQSFKSSIRSLKWTEEYKARVAFIYEAEQAWSKFSASSFIKFLEGYGFKA